MALYLSHAPMLLERTADPGVSGGGAVTLLDSYRGIGPRIAGRKEFQPWRNVRFIS